MGDLNLLSAEKINVRVIPDPEDGEPIALGLELSGGDWVAGMMLDEDAATNLMGAILQAICEVSKDDE